MTPISGWCACRLVSRNLLGDDSRLLAASQIGEIRQLERQLGQRLHHLIRAYCNEVRYLSSMTHDTYADVDAVHQYMFEYLD